MGNGIDATSRSGGVPLSTPDSGIGTSSSASTPAAILPDPQLTSLINGGDIGSAIAAMVMLSSKEDRKAARASRDAAYNSMESAQATQIEHMKESANDKLVGGLTSGALTMASAAAEGGGDAAGGKALDAESKVVSAITDFGASSEDIAAKDAGNAADRAKHVGESSSDDVKDADDVIKKAMDFMKEWSSAKDAAAAAALHRA